MPPSSSLAKRVRHLMRNRLLSAEVSSERDVPRVRQRARQIAELLGFDRQDQTRLGTAVSEIARNAQRYAGKGRIEFALVSSDGVTPDCLEITVHDDGPGIAHLDEILAGSYRSTTGMGIGLLGTYKLMDKVDITTSRGKGTSVRMLKALPELKSSSRAPRKDLAAHAAIAIAKMPLVENDAASLMRAQDRELIETLAILRDKQNELERTNAELEETNRGVLALYRELDEKALSLQRASEHKTAFVAHVSHEVRTPVASIISLTEVLLSRGDGNLTAEQEKQILLVRRSAESLSEIVDDLLDLAKVEAGKATLRLAEVSIDDLCNTLRGTFRPIVAAKPLLSLDVNCDSNLLPMNTDGGKVAQILRNLVSNAIKFTPQGHIAVSIAPGPDDNIHFSVRDTGIGIAPEDQARIFEDFSQVDAPEQAKVKGTGLGLPLSKKLTELLGGRLWLESARGQGTIFHVELPRVHGEVLSAAAEKQQMVFALTSDAEPSLGIDDGRPSIVVVDDDDVARYLIVDLLEARGYRAIEATNGREGLSLAQAADPLAVILDLRMPEMGGFEVIERLRAGATTKDIPIIVHSALPLTTPERTFLEQNCLDVLKKADTPRAVIGKRIDAALARAQARPR